MQRTITPQSDPGLPPPPCGGAGPRWPTARTGRRAMGGGAVAVATGAALPPALALGLAPALTLGLALGLVPARRPRRRGIGA